MDYFELIEHRESCRNFDGRAAEKEKLLKCVDAARLAPSACNGQPWSFVIAAEEESVKTVREAVQGAGMNRFCDKCNSFILVIEEDTVLTSRLGAMLRHTDFRPVDIGLSVSQLVYAAAEQGLSTCILGWVNEKSLKKTFGIKNSACIRLVVAVGYAAEGAHRTKKRKTLEEICVIR